MALRQGARALARSVMQSKVLPTRGGGGGPIKYANAPDKPVRRAGMTHWMSNMEIVDLKNLIAAVG